MPKIDLKNFNSDYEKFKYIGKLVSEHRYDGNPKTYEALYFLIGYINEQHDYYYNMFRIEDQEKQMLLKKIAEMEKDKT